MKANKHSWIWEKLAFSTLACLNKRNLKKKKSHPENLPTEPVGKELVMVSIYKQDFKNYYFILTNHSLTNYWLDTHLDQLRL